MSHGHHARGRRSGLLLARGEQRAERRWQQMRGMLEPERLLAFAILEIAVVWKAIRVTPAAADG